MKTTRPFLLLAAASVAFACAPPTHAQEALRVDTSGNPTTSLNLGSSQITGTLAPARLGSGTPSSSTVLRGDGSWAGTTPTGNTLAATGNLLMGDSQGNALGIAGSANLQRVLQTRAQSAQAAATLPANLLLPANLQNGTLNADGTITVPASGYVSWNNVAGDGTGATVLYGYAVAVGDAPAGALVLHGNYGADFAGSDSTPLPGVYRSTYVVPASYTQYNVFVRNNTAAPITIYYPVVATTDTGLNLLQSFADHTTVVSPPVTDLDFTSIGSSDRAGRYLAEKQTTFAADSVTGNASNAGTLYAPRLSLQTSLANGSVVGLYRGSLFRDSLPFSTLNSPQGIVARDLAFGQPGALPIVSALDPVPNNGIVNNHDGTYSIQWTPQDNAAIANAQASSPNYGQLYVVEINTATEAATPVAARRRMVQAASQASVAATPGSAAISAFGSQGWLAIIHPSDGLAPGSGSYRYEVVSRMSPAGFGTTNVGDASVSGLELVGSFSGYGSLTGPLGFVGDRLVLLHGTTHTAVIGGGSLSRSVLYEMGVHGAGDSASGDGIPLAIYSSGTSGQNWLLDHVYFYTNVGKNVNDGPPYALITHSGNYQHGSIADSVFLGARLLDGTLQGTAIDCQAEQSITIERVYVQGFLAPFGNSMAAGTETRHSVFRQVNSTLVAGRFHDNLVAAESASQPTNANAREPVGFVFQAGTPQVSRNLFWAHGLPTTVSNDNQALGFAWQAGAVGTATHNIIVLDPATPATQASYFQNAVPAGTVLDDNLVICTGAFYAGGTQNNFSWAAYQANNPALDAHSLYVDLSTDPRGLKAVFADPANGDFRWAQTEVARRCAAYCQANGVGPATVTTHWPLVPTIDEAVRLITDL